MNLQALTLDQLAELMTAASKAADKPDVTPGHINPMVADGLPQNSNSTFNLIHVNAWLAEKI